MYEHKCRMDWNDKIAIVREWLISVSKLLIFVLEMIFNLKEGLNSG